MSAQEQTTPSPSTEIADGLQLHEISNVAEAGETIREIQKNAAGQCRHHLELAQKEHRKSEYASMLMVMMSIITTLLSALAQSGLDERVVTAFCGINAAIASISTRVGVNYPKHQATAAKFSAIETSCRLLMATEIRSADIQLLSNQYIRTLSTAPM
jgi:hypothetical protein